MNDKQGNIFGGAMLIAGTCIGAGMLAMPIVTAQSGFLPSLAINLLCWLFMLLTGWLFLETTLWMKDGANLLSMAERFLGKGAKYFGGFCFVFLYGTLLIAYFSAVAPLVQTFLNPFIELSTSQATTLFFVIGFFVIYLGDTYIDRVNMLLMAGLVTTYIALIGGGVTDVETNFYEHSDWGDSMYAIPVLFAVYGYHNVIPSVANHLKRDPKKLQMSLFIGTTIPFLVYILWQAVIIGSIPIDILEKTKEQQQSVIYALEQETGFTWVRTAGRYFSTFAIVTSFLGVAYSMVDFLADGLKVNRKQSLTRLGLCTAAFIPPYLIALANPNVFLTAMHYAGGFGEAILNGLYPILMVWVGRYIFKLPSETRAPGGKLLLIVLLIFTLLIVGMETLHLLNS